jgi:hypothetical protein
MRYLLLSIVTFIIGYTAGVLFGYRSAVVDYVENDAKTLRTMADTMYDSGDEESLPESVQNAIQDAETNTGATSSDEDETKGFQ